MEVTKMYRNENLATMLEKPTFETKYKILGRVVLDASVKLGYENVLRLYGDYASKMQDKKWDILGGPRYSQRFGRYLRRYHMGGKDFGLEYKMR